MAATALAGRSTSPLTVMVTRPSSRLAELDRLDPADGTSATRTPDCCTRSRASRNSTCTVYGSSPRSAPPGRLERVGAAEAAAGDQQQRGAEARRPRESGAASLGSVPTGGEPDAGAARRGRRRRAAAAVPAAAPRSRPCRCRSGRRAARRCWRHRRAAGRRRSSVWSAAARPGRSASGRCQRRGLQPSGLGQGAADDDLRRWRRRARCRGCPGCRSRGCRRARGCPARPARRRAPRPARSAAAPARG